MWFDHADLKADFPQFVKVANASNVWVENTVIPKAEDYINGWTTRVGEAWTDENVPEVLKRIAKNYAVNVILADDEAVRIAKARGQPRFTVSGDEVPLDLNLGRNPLLSLEDEEILKEWAEKLDNEVHTDKIVVRSEGKRYKNAAGGDTDPSSADYIQDDGLPGYFGSGTG